MVDYLPIVVITLPITSARKTVIGSILPVIGNLPIRFLA
jgi:hypothetical protein